jgi:hypothetical protein
MLASHPSASKSSRRDRGEQRHALEVAQKLSHQLRAAENRIAQLEAEVTAYQDQAECAEQ